MAQSKCRNALCSRHWHDVVRYDNITPISTIGRSGREEDGTSLAARVKTLLARRIVSALDRQGLTVREAESRTGNAAADFSRLRQGQLERFSIERLLDMASRLGERLTLTVRAMVEMKAMADSRLKRVIERTQVPIYEQAA